MSKCFYIIKEKTTLSLERPGSASAMTGHLSWDFKDRGQGQNIAHREKHVQSPQGRWGHDAFKVVEVENTIVFNIDKEKSNAK